VGILLKMMLIFVSFSFPPDTLPKFYHTFGSCAITKKTIFVPRETIFGPPVPRQAGSGPGDTKKGDETSHVDDGCSSPLSPFARRIGFCLAGPAA